MAILSVEFCVVNVREFSDAPQIAGVRGNLLEVETPYSFVYAWPKSPKEDGQVVAKFLIRRGIVKALDRIIEEAETELILISAFIKPNDDTKSVLEKAKAKSIHVVYGKKELKRSEQAFFSSLGVYPTFRKELHAKCYLNENEALITSMNLYEFSQENNDEMGILISKDNEEDRQLYDAIYDQAVRWKNTSTKQRGRPQDRPKSVVRKTKSKQIPRLSKELELANGFCIQCRTQLPFKPEDPKPFCYSCYTSWGKTADVERRERNCHACGKRHATSMSRPLCRACFRKYKSIFQAPVVSI